MSLTLERGHEFFNMTNVMFPFALRALLATSWHTMKFKALSGLLSGNTRSCRGCKQVRVAAVAGAEHP